MPFDHLSLQFGYAGLFAVSFASATLLPLASEPVLVALQVLGYSWWALLLVATAGSTLGSVGNYAVGRWASPWVQRRASAVDPAKLARAQRLFDRWGVPALCLAWLPVVGDALTVIAGVAHVGLGRFTLWVAAGKGVRYAVIIGMVAEGLRLAHQ